MNESNLINISCYLLEDPDLTCEPFFMEMEDFSSSDLLYLSSSTIINNK